MKYCYLNESNHSYCLGMSITIDLIRHQKDSIVKIYLSDSIKQNEVFVSFMTLLKKEAISYEWNNQIFDDLSQKENCYVIGEFKKFKIENHDVRHIVIHAPIDAGELGTIIRSMASFSFYKLILIGEIDYFSIKTVRSSMGGIFLVSIEQFYSLEDYRISYPEQDWLFIGQQGKRPLIKLRNNVSYSLLFQFAQQEYYFFQPKPLALSLIVTTILYENK